MRKRGRWAFGIALAATTAWVTVVNAGISDLIFGSGFEPFAQLLSANEGQSGDEFGRSVALDGTTLVIGARGDDELGDQAGAAYVFVRQPDQTWRQMEKLTASDGKAGDRFGRAVDISGDTLIVAAGDPLRAGNLGAAYVFEREPTGEWIERTSVQATDTMSSGFFGISVSIDGAVFVVGDNAVDDMRGAVCVFERSAQGAWNHVDTLVGSNSATDDGFGATLDIREDRLLVGAASFVGDANAAYIFERQSNGQWIEETVLSPPGSASDIGFGQAVALGDDFVAVGAPGDSEQGNAAGATYVYTMDSPGNWTFDSAIRGNDIADLSEFGLAVAADRNRMLIGAERDTFVNDFSGAVYVFDRQANGTWLQRAKRTLPMADSGDAFGQALSLDGSLGLAGASRDEVVSGAVDAGTALIFN